jgi:TrmH family RNA methyltransferase
MEKIILVEPEKPENTGFIARISHNFDADIRLVQPKFNLSEARETANNSQEKLRRSKIFENLDEALQDLEHTVGTKPGRGTCLEEFEPRKNTSLVLGRESRGLTNSELELCDSVIHIDVSGYPSLNLSHAAAILMHSFHKEAHGESGVEKLDAIQDDVGNKTLELLKRSSPTENEAEAAIAEIKKKQ